MKKRIALFGLLAAALTGVASAQTKIRITGSSAFRAATHTAIGNILQPGYTYAYTGTNFTGAGAAIFTGTTKAPTSLSVIIKTSWTGSVGGVKTLAQNLTLSTFLADGTAQSTGGTQNAPANVNEAAVTADVCMSDSFQNSTEFRTPVMVDKVVGVIPFQWVRNNGSPTGISNMTPLLAGNLLSGGILLSQFTGNPADNATIVYAVGRDEDSGTRLTAFAESFFGVFSSPVQYEAIGSPTITDVVPYHVNTVLGTTYGLGHSGYASGGALVAVLNSPGSNTSANPGWLVGYAGVSDAAGVTAGVQATATAAVGAGAVTGVTVGTGGTLYNSNPAITFSGGGGTGATATATVTNGVITAITVTNGGTGYTTAPTVAIRSGAALKWNGFDYSPAAVREGQYTFWSYEHLLYRSGYAQSAVADQLANQIKNVDAPLSGIQLSTMNVGRPVEGGDVTPGNPF